MKVGTSLAVREQAVSACRKIRRASLSSVDALFRASKARATLYKNKWKVAAYHLEWADFLQHHLVVEAKKMIEEEGGDVDALVVRVYTAMREAMKDDETGYTAEEVALSVGHFFESEGKTLEDLDASAKVDEVFAGMAAAVAQQEAQEAQEPRVVEKVPARYGGVPDHIWVEGAANGWMA